MTSELLIFHLTALALSLIALLGGGYLFCLAGHMPSPHELARELFGSRYFFASEADKAKMRDKVQGAEGIHKGSPVFNPRDPTEADALAALRAQAAQGGEPLFDKSKLRERLRQLHDELRNKEKVRHGFVPKNEWANDLEWMRWAGSQAQDGEETQRRMWEYERQKAEGLDEETERQRDEYRKAGSDDLLMAMILAEQIASKAKPGEQEPGYTIHGKGTWGGWKSEGIGEDGRVVEVEDITNIWGKEFRKAVLDAPKHLDWYLHNKGKRDHYHEQFQRLQAEFKRGHYYAAIQARYLDMLRPGENVQQLIRSFRTGGASSIQQLVLSDHEKHQVDKSWRYLFEVGHGSAYGPKAYYIVRLGSPVIPEILAGAVQRPPTRSEPRRSRFF